MMTVCMQYTVLGREIRAQNIAFGPCYLWEIGTRTSGIEVTHLACERVRCQRAEDDDITRRGARS